MDLTVENKNTLSDAEFGVYALNTSMVNLSSKDNNEVKAPKWVCIRKTAVQSM